MMNEQSGCPGTANYTLHDQRNLVELERAFIADRDRFAEHAPGASPDSLSVARS